MGFYLDHVVISGMAGAVWAAPNAAMQVFGGTLKCAITKVALGALAGAGVSAAGLAMVEVVDRLKFREPLSLTLPIIIIAVTITAIPFAAFGAAYLGVG